MNSPHQREQLPDLLSDALDETERARVESHLSECAECARELRQLKRMQSTLAQLPALPAPANLRANVSAALRENKKQAWNPIAFFARDKGATETPSPRALPFALPASSARKLAWGGAAVVGAVGLMLLARPSLQTGAYSAGAPVSEADIASESVQRSANGQAESGASADGQIGADGAPNAVTTAPLPAASPPNANGTAPGTSGTETRNNTKAPAPIASAPSLPGARRPSEPLPPLPPPPPFPPFPQPPSRSDQEFSPPRVEKIAPLPRVETPAFDLFPSIPPPKPSEKKSSLPAPPGSMEKARPKSPKSPPTSASVAPATKPVQTTRPSPAAKTPNLTRPNDSAPKNAPKLNQRSVPSPNGEASESQEPTRSPGAIVPAPRPAVNRPPIVAAPAASDSDFASQVTRDKASISDSQSAPTMPEQTMERAFQAPSGAMRRGRVGSAAPLQQLAQQPSEGWMGGAIEADLKRSEAAPGALSVLTLSVTKAIGNARLFLLTPSGETQVWRGSMNALPIQIKLSKETLGRAKARDGQKFRARLEQIDGEGNPKGSITFDLLLP